MGIAPKTAGVRKDVSEAPAEDEIHFLECSRLDVRSDGFFLPPGEASGIQ